MLSLEQHTKDIKALHQVQPSKSIYNAKFFFGGLMWKVLPGPIHSTLIMELHPIQPDFHKKESIEPLSTIHYSDVKEHLIVSDAQEYLYIGVDYYMNEINHMASKNGHVYLYTLDNGARCYAQYLYGKASFFDRQFTKPTALYYYPLSPIGAEHGIAVDIKKEGTQIEYKCYTVAVYYMNKDGESHLLWKSDTYNSEHK